MFNPLYPVTGVIWGVGGEGGTGRSNSSHAGQPANLPACKPACQSASVPPNLPPTVPPDLPLSNLPPDILLMSFPNVTPNMPQNLSLPKGKKDAQAEVGFRIY